MWSGLPRDQNRDSKVAVSWCYFCCPSRDVQSLSPHYFCLETFSSSVTTYHGCLHFRFILLLISRNTNHLAGAVIPNSEFPETDSVWLTLSGGQRAVAKSTRQFSAKRALGRKFQFCLRYFLLSVFPYLPLCFCECYNTHILQSSYFQSCRREDIKMFQAEEVAGGEAAVCWGKCIQSALTEYRGNGTERKLEEPVIWRLCWDSGTLSRRPCVYFVCLLSCQGVSWSSKSLIRN